MAVSMKPFTDGSLRVVLWTSAAFNLFASLLLAFPESLGAHSGLPATGPRFYRWMLVLFIVLFGGAYAYLARQPCISRSFLGLAALGKTGVFCVSLACCFLGDIPPRAMTPAVCDLAYGAWFAGWLLATRNRDPGARSC